VRPTDNKRKVSMLTAFHNFFFLKKDPFLYTNLHKAVNPILEIRSTQETEI